MYCVEFRSMLYFKGVTRTHSKKGTSDSLMRNAKEEKAHEEETFKGPQEESKVGKVCLNIVH